MGTKVGGYFRRRKGEVFGIQFSWGMGGGGEEVEMNKVAQASHWLYNHMMHKHHHVYSLF